MTDEPFRLGCGECGAKFDTAEQYVDHLLVTNHAPEEMIASLRDGSGLETFTRELRKIQEHAARGQMPPDCEPLSPDDVPDEVREKFEAAEEREFVGYAATLATPVLIYRLDVVANMMEKMAAVRLPSDTGDEIILTIRAASLRLREQLADERRVIESFVTEVNRLAEEDIKGNGPIEGAHHRAIEKVRTGWTQRE